MPVSGKENRMIGKYSEYYNKAPEQIAAEHMAKGRRRKAVFLLEQAALIGLIILFMMGSSSGALFYILILASVALDIRYAMKGGKHFQNLSEILLADCDPVKYRRVMEIFLADKRNRRARSTLLLECALAEFHEDRPADALRHLQEVTYKSPKNPRWIRKYNVEALCRNAVGDFDGRNVCLQKLEQYRVSFQKAEKNRKIMDDLLLDLKVIFKPAGQWGAADAVWIRDRVTLADNRLDQSRWMVREAVYELLHGNREKAYDLLAENERGPLTPGTRMWIERIKSQ